MAYARPLGQTFNQLNLNMYRLPDGQRGALRTTSLALAQEASREDSHHHLFTSDSSSGSHYNPFKGIKRLYSGFRKRRSSARSHSPDDGRLRMFYSTPLHASDAPVSSSPPTAHHSVSEQTPRRNSDGKLTEQPKDSSTCPSPPKSPSRTHKRVRFAQSEPKVDETYSLEEYDRRVVDPWEFLTKEKRQEMREEMNHYTTNEMQLNNVYNTNDSMYCTLCWRKHCHCRALSKDIWKRAKSTSMVRAGA
ncbi:hypothetical protein GQ54DRAFT_294883 [Martensiomyces pterosporus]|nr:hypothetical protein GQ54DRAFT_294883 [Martensiomyces pterosporus]